MFRSSCMGYRLGACVRGLLACTLALVVCSAAWAVVCTQWEPKSVSGGAYTNLGFFNTSAAAASAAVNYDNANGVVCNMALGDKRDRVLYTLTSSNDSNYFVQVTNCANSVTNETRGYVTRTGDYCTVTCAQNLRQDKLITVGYARATARVDSALWRTSDGREFYAPSKAGQPDPTGVAMPTTICDGQCTWAADGAASDMWVGNSPGATGMHPIFRQQGYLSTGATCTAKTAAADPGATPPACDGFIGQVNGVTKCIAKESPSGVTGAAVPAGPKESSAGAGSSPTATGKVFGPNGEYPGAAGDRSSLIDVGGTGTGAGAPVPTSSTGTSMTVQKNPDGSTTTSTTTLTLDVKTCGMPGLPACRIDESGTPSGAGFGGSEKTKLGTDWDSVDGQLPSIMNKADKDTSWSMPSWLPASACTPWTLGTFPEINVTIVIDLCPHKATIDAVVSFFWLFMTLIAVLGMMQRVMMGPSRE